ncbi:MAG: hypothetical protein GXP13_05205 [Gammaproteobacteria bacterium]|nr:hypothetical protein [Gammaproteobacteria bacterium]
MTRKQQSIRTHVAIRLLMVLAILYATVLLPVRASPPLPVKVIVLYPEASPVHARLYQIIIKGMQGDNEMVIMPHQFNQHTNKEELKNRISKKQGQAVIILGKTGISLSIELNLDIPVVTGAHILTRQNRSSVSLAADPGQMFRKLKQLSPKVRRVFVIHNEMNSGWLIKLATIAARKQGLKLEPLVIDTPNDITGAFHMIQKKAQKDRDAIWLPLDPAVPTRVVLPELLKVAWKKDLVIFGNNPLDVKKGILFAMYPDYINIGKQLLTMVQSRIKNKTVSQPEASRYLKMAFNNRTALHLGIMLDSQQLEQINLIYPRR